MENNDNNKKSLFYRLLITTAIVIPLVISFSYAYFLAEVNDDKTNASGTAVTEFNFNLITNSASGYIDDIDIIPINDANADTEASVGTFTVTAGNNAYPIKFSVYLTDIVMDNELKNADFKWKLTSSDTDLDLESGSFSGYTSGDLLLTTNLIINSNSSSTYQLRIWISETDEDQSAILDKSFSARVKVEGEFWNTSFYDDYQMVEYIQNTGSAYINTGVSAKSGIEFFGNFLYDILPTDVAFLGARTTTTNRVHPMLLTNTSMWAIGYGSSYASTTKVSIDKKYFVHSKLFVGEQLLEVDSVELYSNNLTSNQTPNIDLFMFTTNINGSPGSFSKGKMYNTVLYFNGEMVRSFIPCYRKSDNVAGVYDIINDVFYPSIGSNSFVAGPSVN